MTATVGYLKEHLERCIEADPNIAKMPIYLAKDAEGNDFRPTVGDFDILPAEEVGAEGALGHGTRVAVIWPSW